MDMPKIVIELRVAAYEEYLIKQVQKKLLESLKQLDSSISIKFVKTGDDERFPGSKLCYFNLYCDAFISVKDVIKFFDLKWKYFGGGPCRWEIKGMACNFEDEDACWAKYMDGKTFLLDKVMWVLIRVNPIDLDLIKEQT